tara:strand:- start:1052 stop:1177 length:126 start_codon:yes stop_codon:yes gene_type:complete
MLQRLLNAVKIHDEDFLKHSLITLFIAIPLVAEMFDFTLNP